MLDINDFQFGQFVDISHKEMKKFIKKKMTVIYSLITTNFVLTQLTN